MKTALITGASSGFGKAFAYELAKEGYSLILTARRENRLREIQQDIVKEYPVSVEYVVIDLGSPDAPEEIFNRYPDIELLINSAGVGVIGNIFSLSLDQEQQMIDLNIKSLHLLTRIYAVEMTRKKFGGIINIASTSSFFPHPNFAVYAASKAFVLSYTEAVSKELEGTNVHLMALCPGAAYTEFFDKDKMDKLQRKAGKLPLMMYPERIVHEAFTAFKKKKRVFIPGLRHRIFNFLVKLIPREVLLNMVFRYLKG